jgi:hypothetical protein
MRKLLYKNEHQQRIGDFLLEMNILSFEQLQSILLLGTISEEMAKYARKEGIPLTQLNDLTN